MSLPFCFFKLAISSARFPFAKVVLFQVDLSSVLVKTTFGISTIFFANGVSGFLSSAFSQYFIKPSASFLPSKIVSEESKLALRNSINSSSGFQVIQSFSPFGPPTYPFMVICIDNFTFLIVFCFLLFVVCFVLSDNVEHCRPDASRPPVDDAHRVLALLHLM